MIAFRSTRLNFFLNKYDELDREGVGEISSTDFKEHLGAKFLARNPTIRTLFVFLEKENKGRISRKDVENFFYFMSLVQQYDRENQEQEYQKVLDDRYTKANKFQRFFLDYYSKYYYGVVECAFALVNLIWLPIGFT